MKLAALTCLPLLLCLNVSTAEEKTKLPGPAIIDWLVEPLDTARDRIVPLKLFVPESDKPVPVVLFSHGLGGSRDNSIYLGSYWAAAGYAAVFMQHAGSDEEVWKQAPPAERVQAMRDASSGQSSNNRLRDVTFVIDQLEKWNAEKGNPLHGKLNLKKIGMSGHSFGAVTTQGVMGQVFAGNRRMEEPRLTAFLAMSPSSHRTASPAAAFGQISKPVLCMTGTEDSSQIDPSTTPASRLVVYASLPAGDKYQLVFEGGRHHAFGDNPLRANEERISHHHPAIQKISTAFWDAYLKDDETAKAWLQSMQPKSELGLDEKDVWEWK